MNGIPLAPKCVRCGKRDPRVNYLETDYGPLCEDHLLTMPPRHPWFGVRDWMSDAERTPSLNGG